MIMQQCTIRADRFSDRKAGHPNQPAAQTILGTIVGDSVMNHLRENNNNWRGGRSKTAHGYIIVRVGIGHPFADCRGYAYEHRIVASQKIGRLLKPTEKVHHIDGNRQNNLPENLKVVKDNAEHYFEHRDKYCLRRKPCEPNNTISCACGCGLKFKRYDNYGRPRMYISGHNMKVS